MQNKICGRSETIFELLKVINNVPSGFAFIVDEEDRLLGLVTDGDLRRVLLAGFGLSQKVGELQIKMCEFVRKRDNSAKIGKMLSEKIRILPVVDEHMHVVDFIQFDKRSRIPIAEPSFGGNELKYLTDAFLSTWISSSGEYIDRFERDFSDYIGCEYGVATSNGTTALHLALLALGIGEGDEVIVPDLTFAATVNAVLYTGAKPVIVDVETDSWCINPKEIKKAITKKTKAIIPVHLYGQPCDMGKITAIAGEHDICVIEDCAEAHGAEFEGRKVGSFGDISCFSFFGNKIITTGEGGMCLTNKEELVTKLRTYRDHGMSRKKKYWHEVVGYNYRMTNLQAAIGCAQLEKIDNLLEFRRDVESKYLEIFAKYDFISPQECLNDRTKTVWLVSALIKDGLCDELYSWLSENGIDVRRFFYPLSDMELYNRYVFSSKNAKRLSLEGLSFPTHANVDFLKTEQLLCLFAGSHK